MNIVFDDEDVYIPEPVTVTIPAGTYCSGTKEQNDAEALAEAQAQATALLECTPGEFVGMDMYDPPNGTEILKPINWNQAMGDNGNATQNLFSASRNGTISLMYGGPYNSETKTQDHFCLWYHITARSVPKRVTAWINEMGINITEAAGTHLYLEVGWVGSPLDGLKNSLSLNPGVNDALLLGEGLNRKHELTGVGSSFENNQVSLVHTIPPWSEAWFAVILRSQNTFRTQQMWGFMGANLSYYIDRELLQ